MHSFAYAATLTPASEFAEGETGFVVRFPDLPEVVTQGENETDALKQAADALEEAIAARMKHGEDIPPAVYRGSHQVPVPTQTALKAALYLSLRNVRGRQAALAEQLGKDEKEIRRLLDPHHRSRPKNVERALHALGKRVTIVLEDVA